MPGPPPTHKRIARGGRVGIPLPRQRSCRNRLEDKRPARPRLSLCIAARGKTRWTEVEFPGLRKKNGPSEGRYRERRQLSSRRTGSGGRQRWRPPAATANSCAMLYLGANGETFKDIKRPVSVVCFGVSRCNPHAPHAAPPEPSAIPSAYAPASCFHSGCT
jgi:hypothetical protein